MAALTYTIQTQDITDWGTLETILSILQVNGVKILNIAADPLIDPSVLDPSSAYQLS